MNNRLQWLAKYRVTNICRQRRSRKAIWVNNNNEVVKPTHYNLQGGSYCVPRAEECTFRRNYIDFVFGQRGNLSITEAPLTNSSGKSYSSVYLDFDLKYPLNSEGI